MSMRFSQKKKKSKTPTTKLFIINSIVKNHKWKETRYWLWYIDQKRCTLWFLLTDTILVLYQIYFMLKCQDKFGITYYFYYYLVCFVHTHIRERAYTRLQFCSWFQKKICNKQLTHSKNIYIYKALGISMSVISNSFFILCSQYRHHAGCWKTKLCMN